MTRLLSYECFSLLLKDLISDFILVTKYTNKLVSHDLQKIFDNNDFILTTDELSALSVNGFKTIQLNRTVKKTGR